MRYFVDTEYNWEPQDGRLTPISIGLVAEDGREFYAVDANWWDAAGTPDPFVVTTVVPKLATLAHEPNHPACYVHGERATIARDIRAFIGDDIPEFWGDYAAFDYVVLSMLMGRFEDWLPAWPMHVNDLQQADAGSRHSEVPHNALSDARAVRDAWCEFMGVFR